MTEKQSTRKPKRAAKKAPAKPAKAPAAKSPSTEQIPTGLLEDLEDYLERSGRQLRVGTALQRQAHSLRVALTEARGRGKQ